MNPLLDSPLTRVHKRFGTWPSPISAQAVAAQGLRLGAVTVDGQDIYWLEGRPAEGGRNVLVRRSADGHMTELTPPGFDVRTRVHEYGGGAYVVADGSVYFSNFADQRIYRIRGSRLGTRGSGSDRASTVDPVPITAKGDWFYADGVCDSRRRRLICVREDHTCKDHEPTNTLVSIPLEGAPGSGEIIASGYDFYSTPRLRPDGSCLSWICWRHPNMPWDGTELWVADVNAAGALEHKRRIAGSASESIYQPGWSPDGTLYFVSDRDGWWRIYRCAGAQVRGCAGASEGAAVPGGDEGGIVPVLGVPLADAEFARPQWVFGTATWAFATPRPGSKQSRMVVSYTTGGQWHLGVVSHNDREEARHEGDEDARHEGREDHEARGGARHEGHEGHEEARHEGHEGREEARHEGHEGREEARHEGREGHEGRGGAGAGTLSEIAPGLEPGEWLAATPTHAVLVVGSAMACDAVVTVELGSGVVETLRAASTVEIDPGYISVPEAIEFPTDGGVTAHAFYYPPRNKDCEAPADERPPLVVISHGGPIAAAHSTLDLKVQFWTSRGFAVVDVNYGGSSGYGTAYRRRLNGHWGIVDLADTINAATYLVLEEKADARRLIVRGGSAGGYTTLAALTFRPEFFKAGASYYGISDLETLVHDSHKFEARSLDVLVGPYPAMRHVYRARSPIDFVDQIVCPLILFQGLEDTVVPPDQSEKMAEAMRAKGRPVAYLAFEGEQHGFRRAETIVRSQEAELYFYGAVFGFTPADRIEPVVIDNV